MKISIVGSGYVGMSSAIGFSMMGHSVVCIDIDMARVEMINSGKIPFFEKGMEENLKAAIEKKLIHASTNFEYMRDSDVTFITVGTPSLSDGSPNMEYIKAASESIASAIKNKPAYHLVVVKSTVLPGITEEIIVPALEKSGKKAGIDFGVCVNPEFLREGSALQDFLNPDRTVIGELDKKSGDILESLYKDFKSPIMRTNIKTAEMIKYASNAFLPAKVSLINEIGNICKKLGIDVYDVAKGVGYDARIGGKFLNAGSGFGGSCLSKDVSALVKKAGQLGVEPAILKAVLTVNEEQKRKIVDILKKRVKRLDGRKIAILGLAFKPGTDDVRDSVAIVVIGSLLNSGAKISAYDPEAAGNMKRLFPEIEYAPSTEAALKNADACLILTDWPEFKKLTDQDFSVMRGNVIIEGRRVLDRKNVSGVEGICW
ncbi:MAG: UDP-glucose/GDP-mannose dehydrogenase family protein [Candidatus Aenigmarchaeota archaeon]|nr:UDP-glucose/GDP-mannose dehydrogenase family protein [Candidatus Aenigmarchaeota archaeon]